MYNPNAPLFSGTNNKDASSKLPWFPPQFNGLLQVDECKYVVSNAGWRGFCVEFTVLTSNLSDVIVGGRYSWMQKFNERMLDTAHQACIAFLYAAGGYQKGRDDAKIAEIKANQDDILNSLTSPAQPYRGNKVVLQTTNKKTKSGGDFTLHTFSVAPDAAAA